VSKPVSDKKASRSFSMNAAEYAQFEANATRHGFKDRNEYLLALMEADEFLQLKPAFDTENRRVLRPTPTPAQSSDEATVRNMHHIANEKHKSGKAKR
jgi:hypothetical protein